MEGHSRTLDNDLQPYWTQKLELSTHKGCVLWGGIVVVPPLGREPK